jgi:exodeoxyribonuclease III
MKIATWNINSVRLRAPMARKFLRESAPDVLCLQEIKAQNDQFPTEAFSELGYVHQAVNGQKAYNGVAILSRLPFKRVTTGNFCREGHARHICVVLENDIELHNFYVPAGGDVPDTASNPKFDHKLDFLRAMARHFASKRNKHGTAAILVGDLNIAPLENDVWSHKQLLDVVSHTPVETRLLGEVQAAFDWCDVTRHFVPPAEKIYSWWSYRAADPLASDRGRRLDHIWVSQNLKDTLAGQTIVKKMRKWEKASDHVPVVAELTL